MERKCSRCHRDLLESESHRKLWEITRDLNKGKCVTHKSETLLKLAVCHHICDKIMASWGEKSGGWMKKMTAWEAIKQKEKSIGTERGPQRGNWEGSGRGIKLKTLQKVWEDAGEKKQSELQPMKSFGTQRASTAIEIFWFLAVEVPFCASWAIEREVSLFQSHSIPGGASLNSNLCEGKQSHFGAVMKPINGKYSPWEFDNPNSNILHKASVSPDAGLWGAFHFSFELLRGTSDC